MIQSLEKTLKITHLLYFLLIMVCISFVIAYQYSGNSFEYKNIFFLFTLLFLPIFDQIFDLCKDIAQKYKPKNPFELIIDIWIPSFCIIWFFTWYISFLISLGICTLYMIYKKADARIYFLCSLILFCYIAIFLLFWRDTQSETLSITAYYFLVAGVLVQIWESFRTPKTSLQ